MMRASEGRLAPQLVQLEMAHMRQLATVDFVRRAVRLREHIRRAMWVGAGKLRCLPLCCPERTSSRFALACALYKTHLLASPWPAVSRYLILSAPCRHKPRLCAAAGAVTQC